MYPSQQRYEPSTVQQPPYPPPYSISQRDQNDPYPVAGGHPQPVGGQGMPFPGPGGDGPPMPTSSEAPSAPPMNDLLVPSGYEGASFTPFAIQPPLPPSNFSLAPPIERTIPTVAQITEEQVRSAVLEMVNDNCCFGSKPAHEMDIKDITMNSAFHYKLETFTEKRETTFAFKPYKGEPIDGPSNGPSPGPWEVLVTPEVPFERARKVVEVPHSATVKVCHTCVGNGSMRCRYCSGFGGSNCSWCNGNGYDRFEGERRGSRSGACLHCNGTGRQRCSSCHGHGQVRCNTCKGHCQLKCFLQLTILWNNHEEDYVSDETGLSEGLIKQVTGMVAFDERYPRLYPMSNFPDRRIVDASKGLIQRHSTAFPLEKILEQRHHVRMVPVARVAYHFKAKEGTFYCYGLEHNVYFPDYPQKCCCGACCIL